METNHTPAHTALLKHRSTGLLVDPLKGRIYLSDGADIPRQTVNRRPMAVIRGGDSLSLIPCAHIVWEAVHGEVPAGMRVENVRGRHRDIRARSLQLVRVSA